MSNTDKAQSGPEAEYRANWERRYTKVGLVVTDVIEMSLQAASRTDLTRVDHESIQLLGLAARRMKDVALPAVDEVRHRWSERASVGTPLGDAGNGLTRAFNWAQSWNPDFVSEASPTAVSDRSRIALDGAEQLLLSAKEIIGPLADLGIGPVDDALESDWNTQNFLENDLYRLRSLEQLQHDVDQARANAALLQLEVNRARASADKVEQTVETTDLAAGRVGEDTLITDFETYAATQRKEASRWFWTTISMLAIVIAIGGVLVFLPDQSVAEVIARLAVASPIAGLAAYSARVSTHRRDAAEWATLLAVQLRTVGAYSAPLSEVHQEELRLRFGQYIYGPQVAAGENSLNAVPPELLEAVVKAVRPKES